MHYQNLSMDDINGEIWRPIIGYEGLYEVSSFGRVKRISAKTHIPHIMKTRLTRGYQNVCLCKDNKKKGFRVHRLEAFAFLPIVKGKPYVNHKDGIRHNNEISNLEWCNNSENQLHSFRELGRVHVPGMLGKTGALCKNSKKVIQLDLSGNKIAEWGSASEAQRSLNFGNISLACTRGLIRHGYKWEYA